MISYIYANYSAWANILSNKLRSRKGQNTVEYLLMLAVVVGVVLIAGVAIKNYMPELFKSISNMISGAANQLSKTEGN